MLSNQVNKEVVIFLNNVSFSNLKALVDYMYRGVVNVGRDQLSSFLHTAEALQVKGLQQTGSVLNNSSTQSPEVAKLPEKNKTMPLPPASSLLGTGNPQIAQCLQAFPPRVTHPLKSGKAPEHSLLSKTFEAQLNSLIESADQFIAVDPKIEFDMDNFNNDGPSQVNFQMIK